MVTRLPIPGSDEGNWGEILNAYLLQAHQADGALKPITEANLSTGLQTKVNAVAGFTGATGAIGPSGPQGDPGVSGAQGATGPSGPSGTPGTPGTDGATGATGAPGATGVTGPVGATGAPGSTTIDGIAGLRTELDGKAAISHTHTASQISDSTAVGRAVLTAPNAAAAQSALAITGAVQVVDSFAEVTTPVYGTLYVVRL